MGVIGGAAGYATVNPTQGNPMGEALSNVENSAFRYKSLQNEEQQVKAKAERDLQEGRRRDFSESQKFSKENPFVATGTGLDAVNRQSYMNAKDSAANAYAEYMKTGDQKHLASYQNAIASVNNLSNIPTQINALKEDWVKNVGAYNPESLKRKAVLLDKLSNGQVVQTNDDNGNPRYTIFDKDENGNISKLNQKNISGEELLKSLNPEKAFNIDGKEGFIDVFNKNIGKERKVIEGSGLNAVEKTYNPGADELAKIMADDAVNDRSKMYETLSRMGLDPEDDENYSNADVKRDASKYLQKMLMVTAPTTVSKKPDTSLEMLNLAKTKEANDERQRRIDNARDAKKDAKEADEDGQKTSFARFVTKTPSKLEGTNYDIPKGSGKMVIISKGAKDIAGGVRVAQEVYVKPNGEVIWGIREKNIDKSKLTPEAEQRKKDNPNNFVINADADYQTIERVKYYDTKNKADKVAPAILNTTNPETGKLFKNTVEADDWARKNTNAEKSTAKKIDKKTDLRSKYNY